MTQDTPLAPSLTPILAHSSLGIRFGVIKQLHNADNEKGKASHSFSEIPSSFNTTALTYYIALSHFSLISKGVGNRGDPPVRENSLLL